MQRPASIPLEVWLEIPAHLRDCIATIIANQEQEIAQLQARVAELEAKLNQNSSNSSKPPSSNGPQVPSAPPKKPSGKKRGGQPGHPKHERVILPPDEVIDHKPSHCHHCATQLVGADPDPIIDQVIELPVKLRHVIHHRRHTLTCPHCQVAVSAAAVPEATSGFGPNLTAVTAYLSGVGRMSKRTIRTFYSEVCDIPISLGSVSKLERTVSEALKPIHAEAHEAVQGQTANVDETSWKEGTSKAWLWVAVTTLLTVFLIRLKRNRTSFHDLQGPTPGVLTTDRFSVYSHLESGKRQVCWAHLRRDFQAMVDRKNCGSAMGAELLVWTDFLFEHWPKVRDGTQPRSWFETEVLPDLRASVRVVLERGQKCGCAKTEGVCRELRGIESSLWTFVVVSGVEPTNNAAERAVRHAVCWRKTSLGTDSERGSRFVERLLTVVASCRSQGRGVLEFLKQAVRGEKPSLLPIKA